MINLESEYLKMLKDILNKNIPDFPVYLFGSRTTNTIKAFSDIDLIIMTNNNLPSDIVAQLTNEIDESNIPYKVDIVEWHLLSDSLKNSIQKQFVKIQ